MTPRPRYALIAFRDYENRWIICAAGDDYAQLWLYADACRGKETSIAVRVMEWDLALNYASFEKEFTRVRAH